MMTLVNMDDEGLTILPTHRLLHSLPKLTAESLLKDVSRYFEVQEMPSFDALAKEQVKATDAQPRLGLYIGKKYYLLTIKDLSVMDREVTLPQSSDWKHLDVSILHTLVLEKILGITLEHQAQQTNLTYERYADEAIAMVDSKEEQLVFFLNSTKIQQVLKLAEQGEVMPQKSTDFFPKLLTGLVFQQIA